MAGRGRGRGGAGRGFRVAVPPDQQSGESTRPGGLIKNVAESGISPNTSTEYTLSDLISCLSIASKEAELNELEAKSRSFCYCVANVLELVDGIYHKCIDDKEYSKSCALLCHKLALIECDGRKFRSYLLSKLQQDYKNRDRLIEESTDKFLGMVSFLCQVFLHMRDNNNEPFKALIGPICECLELLLVQGSGTDEIECCALQLQDIGGLLQELKQDKMKELLMMIRAKIIHTSSRKARCLLLEVLELYANQWKTLPLEVTQFYSDILTDIIAKEF